MADFLQAVEWIKEGKKVTKKTYPEGVYIYCNPQHNRLLKGLQGNEDKYFPDYEITAADVLLGFDEWKIYKETDWNLAIIYKEQTVTEEDKIRAIKTFIQKVKEDIKKHKNDIFGESDKGDILKIIDKRVGDL